MSTESRARQKFVAESRVIEPIVLQHAEEAAFLWLLRDAAVRSPHYSLRELTRLDSRIDAHLDGLSVAGEHGWRTCVEELDWAEPGEVFTASAIAFASNDVARMQPILETVRQNPDVSRAMIAAIGFLPHRYVMARIAQLSVSQSPEAQFISLSASAIHRIDPGTVLNKSLESDDPRLLARARRAVGEMARRDLMPQLRSGLKDDDPIARFWGAWSLGVLGDRGVADVLQEFVSMEFARWREAVNVAARIMELARAHIWRTRLAGDGATSRQAIVAAGAIGDPVAITWLIEIMNDKKLARVAGESFSMITGADLTLLDLEATPPEDSDAGPTDDAEDESVAMDQDQDLPWPDVGQLREWWADNENRFVSGKRYLMGRVIDADSLSLCLREGTQRQRWAAALELVLTAPNSATPLFEVRSNSRVQRQSLGINSR